jgi:hypothetical protein
MSAGTVSTNFIRTLWEDGKISSNRLSIESSSQQFIIHEFPIDLYLRARVLLARLVGLN